MAKDLNKWMGIGRLGKDPETKYLPSGAALTNIVIACGDDYKDKQTGQKVEKTEWVRISAFGRLAEIMGEYLKKGSKIYIEGKFTTRKWQNQQGEDQYSTEINASEMQMLDTRAENGGQGGGAQQQNYGSQQQGQQQAPRQNQGNPPQQSGYGQAESSQGFTPPPQQPAPQQNQNQPTPAQTENMDSFDDDIPF